MTIDLNPIPRSDFETEVLKNKDAVRWFIWHARQKVDGIEFNSLQNDNKDIGVCFFIENNESIEVGILIQQDSRQKGYGSIFIKQLMKDTVKPLIFHVSRYNISSLLFFRKFVDSGVMVSRVNEKGNSVFETSPSKS
jgi:hypothetical protein